jgi:hypothetical protein
MNWYVLFIGSYSNANTHASTPFRSRIHAPVALRLPSQLLRYSFSYYHVVLYKVVT